MIRQRTVLALLTLTAALAAAPAAHATPADRAFALRGSDLVTFDPAHPATTATSTPIVDVTAGETLVGLDVRPANGVLYALGVNGAADTGTLYVVGPQNGYASPVGVAGSIALTLDGATPIDLPAEGYGFDVNPAADRIRVTTDTGLNFRINPNTGAPVDGDNGGSSGSVIGLNADGPLHGAATSAGGFAYTNSGSNVGTVTTGYALSAATGALLIQNPPNAGNEVEVAPVTLGGAPLAFSATSGFDVDPAATVPASNAPATGGDGYALLTVSGTTHLYKIALAAGTATDLGPIGDGTGPWHGLALQRDVAAGGFPAVGLAAGSATLRRFLTDAPGTAVTQAINTAALSPGETLVSIAWRPATGQLLALGVDAAADTGTLYVVDPQTGALTMIGSAGALTWRDTSGVTPIDLPASGWGMDVNPAVDRVRLVADGGFNARANPFTGAPIDGNKGSAIPFPGTNPDGPQTGLPAGATGVVSAAYTNAYAQPLTGGVTTLYVLEPYANALMVQTPPNAGNLTAGRTITAGGAPLDFGVPAALDLPGEVAVGTANAEATGAGFAALVVGGTPGVYRIDLATGAATPLGTTAPTTLSGLAVGTAARNAVALPPIGDPGPGPGGNPPPSTVPKLPGIPNPDRTAPKVAKLSVKARARKRLTITFTTSEAGRATVQLQRRVTGRRTTKRTCVAGRKKGARCTLYKTYKTVTKTLPKGKASIATTGRTGAVRVVVTVRDAAGNRSKPATRATKVKR